MVIERNGEKIELTAQEVFRAYEAHRLEMCRSDVEWYLDDRKINATDEQKETLAYEWKHMLDHMDLTPEMYENALAFDDVMAENGNFGMTFQEQAER